jgi:hypothetical protein
VTTNGRRAYRVRRSPLFEEKLAQRSQYLPRLDRVLEGVEWRLAQNPGFNARHVAGSTWVIESERDVEAPTVWVYFTLDGSEVIMQSFEIVSDWETPGW